MVTIPGFLERTVWGDLQTRVPNKFKDWTDAIREHVADLDALARRGDALREHIQGQWMLEDNLDVWLKAWLPS